MERGGGRRPPSQGRRPAPSPEHPGVDDEPKEPKDVMTQKNYYQQLVGSMEDIKLKSTAMTAEIEEESREKLELQEEIAVLEERLREAEEKVAVYVERREKLDRALGGLEEPGLSAEAMARRVKMASMQDEGPLACAEILRAEYLEATMGGAGAGIQKGDGWGAIRRSVMRRSSVDPRGGGGGPEEVCAHDFIANAGSGGRGVAVRHYVAAAGRGGAEDAPVVVFFHGGGFVCGDLETHDRLCRALASLAGADVVAVDYRRAPEHRFPAAFEDCYDALSWVAAGGLGRAPPRRVAVAGDEAGAGLAVACCLRARDDPEAAGPAISLQLLINPWLDLRPDAPSLGSEFANGECSISREELKEYFDLYAPKKPTLATGSTDGGEETATAPGGMTSTAAAPEWMAAATPEGATTVAPEGATTAAPEGTTGAAPEGTNGSPEDGNGEEVLDFNVDRWWEDPRASPLLDNSVATLPRAFIAYTPENLLANQSLEFAGRICDETGPEAAHLLQLQGPHHRFYLQAHQHESHAALAAAGAFVNATLWMPCAK